MSDELIRKAKEAEFLLNHDLIKEAFEHIERKYINKWRASQFGANEAREIAYFVLSGLAEFKAELNGYIEDVAKIKHNINQNEIE
jgi:hypothetical protein